MTVRRADRRRQPAAGTFPARSGQTLKGWYHGHVMAAAPAAAVSPNRVTAQNLASMTCSGSLSIRGDVERPACLTLAELRCLMDAWLVTDFRCHEGWSRLGERWSAEEPQAPPRAGFPRLVGPPGWDWFLSVKSVDWIQVTREPQRATAATIALARLEG